MLEVLGTLEVLLDINTIHQGIHLEGYMQFQNLKVSQVCLSLDIREGYKVHDLQRDLRNIKHPTFYGHHKQGEHVESWLPGMRKYFQLHNYSSNLKAIIKIYLIQWKVKLWWDHIKKVKHIDEKGIS